MRACSDSIAQLASALAKAQTELVNPVKTLTGVINKWGSGNEGQSYRYAPLSAGLDIVRSTLCKHELALIQTTHVDRDTAMVLLRTTLAHGSGEWICATWPICRTLEMTNPKIMGAALTYARRYGLFTLVGIAGEDDLDAPELQAPQDSSAATSVGGGRVEPSTSPTPASGLPIPAERLGPVLGRTRRKRSDAGLPRGRRAPPGAVENVMRELAEIEESDALFQWALGILPFRNSLPESSRATLDAAFFEKADEVGADPELLAALASRPGKPNGVAPPGSF
jgi:hypothetical protein